MANANIFLFNLDFVEQGLWSIVLFEFHQVIQISYRSKQINQGCFGNM